MPKFKCKGADLKPFVKALSVLGKNVTEFRLESNGAVLMGSGVPEAHNALIMVNMDLSNLQSEEMGQLLVGVDMRDFRTIVDLADADDDLEVVMDLGRFNMKIGAHIQRSFPLIGQVPAGLNPKAVPPFTWKFPAGSMKQLVKVLDLDDKFAKLHIEMADGGLMFRTETYSASARASYTIPLDQILGASDAALRFDTMYALEDFATLKDLPAEGELTFRAGQNLPLEVLAATGRLSIRAMYAPLVTND